MRFTMKKAVWMIGIFSILLIAGVIVYFMQVTHYYGKPDGPGTFGDLFGGLNVILTGLVLVATVYSLYRSESLNLENKIAMSDQATIQEINMVLERIKKWHLDPDLNARIVSILTATKEEFKEVIDDVHSTPGYYGLSVSDVEDLTKLILHAEDKLIEKFASILEASNHIEIIEYMQLVKYMYSKLDMLNHSSTATPYSLILSSEFPLLHKEVILLYAFFYETNPRFGNIPRIQQSFLRDLYNWDFMSKLNFNHMNVDRRRLNYSRQAILGKYLSISNSLEVLKGLKVYGDRIHRAYKKQRVLDMFRRYLWKNK